MSAHFHLYLCGRIAAEWLINMEKEYFFSGYCRTVDGSRMVSAVTEDGKLTEVDCSFEHCPYTANCTIAKEIEQHL